MSITSSNPIGRLETCISSVSGPLAVELTNILGKFKDYAEQQANENRRRAMAQADAIAHSAEIITELEATRERLEQANCDAEIACREAQRNSKFGDILERSLNEIFIFDAESLRFLIVNRGARNNLGYSMEELLHLTPLDIKPEYSLTAFKSLMEPLLIGEANYIDFSCSHQRKDGSRYEVEVRLQLDIFDDRKVYVAIIQDVTEKRRASIEREKLQKQLVSTSRAAGMAEVATDVLHNVGNVLNSANVSTELLLDRIGRSRVSSLEKLAAAFSENQDDLAGFLSDKGRGKHLPEFLNQIAGILTSEREETLSQLTSLRQSVDHMKQIISRQQSYARQSGASELIDIARLIDDAVQINEGSLATYGIDLSLMRISMQEIITDRHQVLQILTNLISNAKDAVKENTKEKTISIRTIQDDQSTIVEVIDNGVGIETKNLKEIFRHGFTTKDDGHGFGLHSSALAAQGLGGSLSASSDGLGLGARFKLTLPTKGSK